MQSGTRSGVVALIGVGARRDVDVRAGRGAAARRRGCAEAFSGSLCGRQLRRRLRRSTEDRSCGQAWRHQQSRLRLWRSTTWRAPIRRWAGTATAARMFKQVLSHAAEECPADRSPGGADPWPTWPPCICCRAATARPRSCTSRRSTSPTPRLGPGSPMWRHARQQSRRRLQEPGALRRGGGAVQAGARDGREDQRRRTACRWPWSSTISPRSTRTKAGSARWRRRASGRLQSASRRSVRTIPTWPRASTTWPTSTSGSADMPRPTRCSGAPSRSGRSRWGRSIPISPPPCSTSPACTRARSGSTKRRRSTSARSASGRRCSAPITWRSRPCSTTSRRSMKPRAATTTSRRSPSGRSPSSPSPSARTIPTPPRFIASSASPMTARAATPMRMRSSSVRSTSSPRRSARTTASSPRC